jgi:hypothetical protein
MLRKLSLWLWSPGRVEMSLFDTARALHPRRDALWLRLSLERLLADSYGRGSWR